MLHEAVCCQLLTKDIGGLNFLSRCCTLLGVAYAGLMLLFFLPLFDYNISHNLPFEVIAISKVESHFLTKLMKIDPH